MARLFFFLALLSLLSGFFGLAYGGVNASSSQEYKVYIVYMGSTGGMEPEKLTASHHQLLDEILGSPNAAGGSLIYSYKYGFNGFSALLTDDHAKTLAAKAGVVSVFPSQTMLPETINSYDFLRLSKEKAVEIGQLGGSSVIIGVLDTGVWPDLPSFDDSRMGPIPTGWKGACNGGVDFKSSYCNRKLIGVRYFGLGARASIKKSSNTTSELLNLSALDTALDTDGHGTHVATTAGGSVVEDAYFSDLMKGAARGGNPMVRIAVYKVCWPEPRGCTEADVLAGYDSAIQDGVHIISASLGFPRPAEIDSIFIGSFHAMSKGILNVCAAGNTGPMANTVHNVAPWVITVGASTIDRDVATWIRLGNNETFMGYSFFLRAGTPRPLQELVHGGDIPSASSSFFQSRLCLVNSLDATRAIGKIVFCEQVAPGNQDVATKREYLQQIRAAGMIIIDDAYMTFPHFDTFPFSVVISSVGQSIVNYIRSSSQPTAVISDPEIVWNAPPHAPAVAGFSSRGPNSISASILKPDIIAPGVTILAATTPLASPKLEYTLMSGTSMATPHVSGIAALVKSQFSHWSPAVIKSALMTSVVDSNTHGEITTNTGAPASPYDYGNGCLNPLLALNPGLVYDLDPLVAYSTYLCNSGLTQAQISAIIAPSTLPDCPSPGLNPLTISQINLPSIAISELRGVAVIERTVTNVGPSVSTYTSSFFAPASGVEVSVSPAVLQFSASVQSLTYRITFRVVSTLDGGSAFGAIIWSSGQYRVRSSIAINSVVGSLREEPSLMEA